MFVCRNISILSYLYIHRSIRLNMFISIFQCILDPINSFMQKYIYMLMSLTFTYFCLFKSLYRSYEADRVGEKQIESSNDDIGEKLTVNKRLSRNRSTSQIFTIHLVLDVCAKNFEDTLLFVDFSNILNGIHRRKTEKILLAYGLPRKIVAAMMIL